MAMIGSGVENALHCLRYFTHFPEGTNLTAGDVAEFQGISETYLAKIFTKLKKAGILRSSVGSKGGYELAIPAAKISFWDVVVAIEGRPSFFECRNILRKMAINKNTKMMTGNGPQLCEIHRIMNEAAEQAAIVLKRNTLASLSKSVEKKIPKEDWNTITEWFAAKKGEE